MVIDTKKAISNITWNDIHPDEVALTFSFSSDIWVYNLSLLPQDPGYHRILQPTGVTTSGGHKQAIFWTKENYPVETTMSSSQQGSSGRILQSKAHPASSQNNPATPPLQYLIAGSVNGHVRCWRLRRTTQSHNRSECLWNMQVGPSGTPIVHLQRISNSSRLLAVNQEGLVHVWDLDMAKPTAFSATGSEPALVFVVDFHALLVTNANSADVRILRVLSGKHNGSQPYHLTVLLSTGLVCTLDVQKRRIREVLRTGDHASMQTVKAIVHVGRDVNAPVTLHADALSNGTVNEVLHNLSAQQAFEVSYDDMIIVPSLPGAPPPGCTATPGVPNNSHVALSLHSNSHDTTTLRYIHLSTASLLAQNRYRYQGPSPHATGLLRPQLQTAVVESALVRTTDFSYTLPGRIVRAVPGEKEIVTSCDLQQYLGNFALCQSTQSRCCDVRFEWVASATDVTIPATCVMNADGEDEDLIDTTDNSVAEDEQATSVAEKGIETGIETKLQDHQTNNCEGQAVSTSTAALPAWWWPTSDSIASTAYSSSTLTSLPRTSQYQQQDSRIVSVRAHVLHLHDKYTGPAVLDGEPRVHLRTKLTPQQHISDSSKSSSGGIHSSAADHTSLLHESRVPFHVTAAIAHSVSPFVFLGRDDGSIVLLQTRRGEDYVCAEHAALEIKLASAASAMDATANNPPAAFSHVTAVDRPHNAESSTSVVPTEAEMVDTSRSAHFTTQVRPATHAFDDNHTPLDHPTNGTSRENAPSSGSARSTTALANSTTTLVPAHQQQYLQDRDLALLQAFVLPSAAAPGTLRATAVAETNHTALAKPAVTNLLERSTSIPRSSDASASTTATYQPPEQRPPSRPLTLTAVSTQTRSHQHQPQHQPPQPYHIQKNARHSEQIVSIFGATGNRATSSHGGSSGASLKKLSTNASSSTASGAAANGFGMKASTAKTLFASDSSTRSLPTNALPIGSVKTQSSLIGVKRKTSEVLDKCPSQGIRSTAYLVNKENKSVEFRDVDKPLEKKANNASKLLQFFAKKPSSAS